MQWLVVVHSRSDCGKDASSCSSLCSLSSLSWCSSIYCSLSVGERASSCSTKRVLCVNSRSSQQLSIRLLLANDFVDTSAGPAWETIRGETAEIPSLILILACLGVVPVVWVIVLGVDQVLKRFEQDEFNFPIYGVCRTGSFCVSLLLRLPSFV